MMLMHLVQEVLFSTEEALLLAEAQLRKEALLFKEALTPLFYGAMPSRLLSKENSIKVSSP